jgi:CHASE3 domain sensor protein
MEHEEELSTTSSNEGKSLLERLEPNLQEAVAAATEAMEKRRVALDEMEEAVKRFRGKPRAPELIQKESELTARTWDVVNTRDRMLRILNKSIKCTVSSVN